MKHKRLATLLLVLPLAMTLASCSLDNFDGPDASIEGAFYDDETGELVQQEIINGTKIRYEENGWDNPEQQTMVVRNDGTYRNTKMFSGSYDFYFQECNFIPPVRLIGHEIKKGKNRLDFKVQPYIRIRGAVISKEGNKIVAKFHVQPTVKGYQVESIGLFAHSDEAVGAELSSVKILNGVNATINGMESYTLEIDLDTNRNKLEAGQSYWFRVGAKIKTAGARYNYAKAVKITV